MKQLSERELDVWSAVLLGGLVPLAGERTPQSLYYILVGRKAHQTIQDVHHYRLHPYYRLFPGFLRERWQDFVTYFLQQGWLEREKADSPSGRWTFRVTAQGERQRRAGWRRYRLAEWLMPLDGIACAERLELFWLRLHLLVQTISQLERGQPSFYPVVQRKQIQEWVKRLFTRPGLRRHVSGSQLYQELLAALTPHEVALQRLLVEQLSGADQVGCTLEQLASRMDEPLPLLHIKLRYLLTRIVRQVQAEGAQRFPLLSALAAVESGGDPRLSASAGETYRLLKQGLGIAEIARRRGLKQGTIEDHLVEIALHCPEWDPAPYLTEAQKQQILATSRRAGTKRLRVMKELLGEEYSYLQIRLALAQERGEEHG